MRKNVFLVIITLISVFLMFSNLGDRFMAGDEVHTSMIAQSIQKTGLPYASYNEQLVSYNDVSNLLDNTSSHPQLSENHLVRAQSWIYFYVEALSISVFGTDNFSLRLPFAIIGIFTIILFYFFAKKFTKNNKNSDNMVKISVILLAFSTIFYLYSRQARYFSLIMLSIIWLLYSYINFTEKKDNSFPVQLVLSSLLLFYSNYAVFFALFPGIIFHFFVFKHYKNRKNLFNMIKSLCIIFIFTFPWFCYLNLFSYSAGEMTSAPSYIFYAATGFFYIFAVMGFPYVFLFFIPNLLKEKNAELKQNYMLIFFSIISFILVLSLHNEPIQVRYLVSLLPLICLLNGSIILKIWEKKKIFACLIVMIMIFSNILLVFPFNFVNNINITEQLSGNYEKTDVVYFIDRALALKLPFVDYIYEITHNYRSAEQNMIEYISAKPGDYFITNSEGLAKTIMFHTGMKYIESQSKLKTIKPNWIFLWQAAPVSKEDEKKMQKFEIFINENINLENYKKTEIDYPNVKYSETPDPVHHRYKLDISEKQGIIIVYHLKD